MLHDVTFQKTAIFIVTAARNKIPYARKEKEPGGKMRRARRADNLTAIY
jgi:hypothetical protein